MKRGLCNMELIRVDFNNFRSLKDITINFDPKCRILVGINESGKSNILRGLSFLNPDVDPVPDDIRELLPGEETDQQSYVRFVFSLNDEDQKSIYKMLLDDILVSNVDKPIVKNGQSELNLMELVRTVKEGLYRTDLNDQNKYSAYWIFPNKNILLPGWKKPSGSCPPDFMVKTNKGQKHLTTITILEKGLSEIPESYLTDLTIENLHEFVGSKITDYIDEKLPECIVWKYQESNLLPAEIITNQFSANPEICIPLKRMFNLADIKDIDKEISDAKIRSNGMINLLRRVAGKTTKHIKEIWPEYGDIKIDLRENGDLINITVHDIHNLYNLERRSDGFKRFITLLIMISTRVRTKDLQNTLFIQDDPDNGLHPTGIRYLLDEFIKISKLNYVVLSTHSIFMIDRENLGRHLIVKKKNEITSIEEANESNIVEEEVLYNALGFSFTEILKNKNLIFEGWTDKHIFRLAISRIPKGFNDIKDCLKKDLGYCHAEGVKDLKRITMVLELANKDYLIISDGDQVARQHQKEFNGDGEWIRYNELLPSFNPVTVEDFIKRDFVEKILNDISKTDERMKDATPLIWNSESNILEQIRLWIRTHGIGSEDEKSILDSIKSKIFESLTISNIRDEYYEMLKSLSKKLKSNS